MSRFRTRSDVVMAEEFAETGVMKKTSAAGIQYVGNYDSLISTTVVGEGPEGIRAGDRVFVAGLSVKLPWAKAKFEFDGKKVVFIPVTDIKLIESVSCATPERHVVPGKGVCGSCDHR